MIINKLRTEIVSFFEEVAELRKKAKNSHGEVMNDRN